MKKKKVSMLGSFAVGKTSLIRRFVFSIFSDQYLTTIGVKIDQKILNIDGEEVILMLWDIHGEDEFQEVKTSYLVGSASYFLVMDGTRKSTFEVCCELNKKIQSVVGVVPFILLINKCDLTDEWDIDDEMMKKIEATNWTIMKTSAKTGENVEEAFTELTQKMIGK